MFGLLVHTVAREEAELGQFRGGQLSVGWMKVGALAVFRRGLSELFLHLFYAAAAQGRALPNVRWLVGAALDVMVLEIVYGVLSFFTFDAAAAQG